MKNILKTVGVLLLICGFAYAAREGFYEKINTTKPQWFPSGLYIGSNAKNPVSDTNNKIAYSLEGTMVNDFPAITIATGNCKTSYRDGVVTGCTFNDTLSLGVDQTLPEDIVLFPYLSAANTFKIRACITGITDAGSIDLPDASYTIRCIGN